MVSLTKYKQEACKNEKWLNLTLMPSLKSYFTIKSNVLKKNEIWFLGDSLNFFSLKVVQINVTKYASEIYYV